MSIKLKLAGAFGLVVFLTATVGVVSYFKLSALNETVNRNIHEAHMMKLSQELESHVSASIRSEKNAIMSSTGDEIARFSKLVLKEHKTIRDLLDKLKVGASAEALSILTEVDRAYQVKAKSQEVLIKNAALNSNNRAHQLADHDGKPQLEEALAALSAVSDKVARSDNAANPDTLAAIRNLRGTVQALWTNTLDYILVTTSDELIKQEKALQGTNGIIQEQIGTVRSALLNGHYDFNADGVIAKLNAFLKTDQAIIATNREGGNIYAVVESMGPEAVQKTADFMNVVDRLIAHAQQKMTEGETAAAAAYEQARIILLVVVGIALVAAVVA
ncbi:MAG TPA: MCP four helix bundle domain-containing protein, partial [Methylovirgula sp.]|nr:MCP four helix bundle domain-containing protein [Methylovirgula sp.]